MTNTNRLAAFALSLAVTTLLGLPAMPLAQAAGADVKVQELKAKINTKGAIVNSAVLGSTSNMNVGGITTR